MSALVYIKDLNTCLNPPPLPTRPPSPINLELNACTAGETEECVLKAKDQLLTVIADNNHVVDLHFGSSIKHLIGTKAATLTNVRRTPTYDIYETPYYVRLNIY